MAEYVELRVRQQTLASIGSGIARMSAPDLRRLLEPRIVGGTGATASDNPFQVALLSRAEPDNAAAQFCGGTLVRPNYVVTAAHCSDFVTADQVQVLTGTLRLDGSGTRHNVTRIVVHPSWNGSTFDHDVAVWQLSTSATGVPLATLAAEDGPDGQDLLATGWGALAEGGGSPIDLQKIAVPLVPKTNCNDADSYNGRITDNMICAGRDVGGRDTCQGDSGGPLTRGAGNSVLTGITSWGDGCARPNLFGVYARVSRPVIRDFIESNLGGQCTFTVVAPNDAWALKGDLTNLILGDYNADGRMDFIRQEKGAWDDDNIRTAEVFLSRGDGSFTIVAPNDAWALKGDLTSLIPGDFNGDRRTDFIRQEKGAWDDDNVRTAEVFLSRGDGTFTIVAPTDAGALKGDLTSLIPGDYNADGKTDFIRQEKAAWDDDNVRTAEVFLSRGDGSFTIGAPNDAVVLKGDLTNLIPGDFNADGKTDFIRQEKGAWDDDNIRTAEVFLSRGDGSFTIVAPNDAWALKGDFTDLVPGDYNADGRMDFVRQEKGAWDDDNVRTAEVFLSRGDGSFTIVAPNDAWALKGDLTSLIPGDFNGDRKADFIRQEKGPWDDDNIRTAEVFRSKGDGSFTIVAPNDAAVLKGDLTSLIPGDFNADGKADFIRQEKGAWDDDNVRTAEVFLSGCQLTN